MSVFGGHFEAVRGRKKLGSSREFVRTLISDPFAKEFQLFLDLNDFFNIFSLGASLSRLEVPGPCQ